MYISLILEFPNLSYLIKVSCTYFPTGNEATSHKLASIPLLKPQRTYFIILMRTRPNLPARELFNGNLFSLREKKVAEAVRREGEESEIDIPVRCSRSDWGKRYEIRLPGWLAGKCIFSRFIGRCEVRFIGALQERFGVRGFGCLSEEPFHFSTYFHDCWFYLVASRTFQAHYSIVGIFEWVFWGLDSAFKGNDSFDLPIDLYSFWIYWLEKNVFFYV